MFGRKKRIVEKAKTNDINIGYVKNNRPPVGRGKFLYANNYPLICATACSVCWDKPIPDNLEGILQYNAARIKSGHTSILEHSNIVTYYEVPDEYNMDLVEFLTATKYLNIKAHHSKTRAVTYVIVGGSIRGYRDLIENITSMKNYVLGYLLNTLPQCVSHHFFIDFIDRGIFVKEQFNDTVPTSTLGHHPTDVGDNKDIYFENVDNVNDIRNALNRVCIEADLFTEYELLDMATITVLFKDTPRIISQQITRHRNAITQESQRYVDYYNAKFVSPSKFKPEKYAENEKYRIRVLNTDTELTLQQLGDMLVSVYSQLTKPLNKDSTPLLKEDARAYLPNNTASSKLYMTFTYRTLFKFIDLRTDKHAQADIRLPAELIYNGFNSAGYMSYTAGNLDNMTPRSMELKSQNSLLESDDPYTKDCEEIIEETIIEN